MTPVFGAVWAYLILGEALTYHECTGAALVVGAIVLSIPPPRDRSQAAAAAAAADAEAEPAGGAPRERL